MSGSIVRSGFTTGIPGAKPLASICIPGIGAWQALSTLSGDGFAGVPVRQTLSGIGRAAMPGVGAGANGEGKICRGASGRGVWAPKPSAITNVPKSSRMA